MCRKCVGLVLGLFTAAVCLLPPARASLPGEVYSLDFDTGCPWQPKAGGGIKMEIDREVAHGGKASLRLSAPEEDREKHDGEYAYGPFGVKPNTRYVLTLWVKGDQVVSKGGTLALINQTVPLLPTGGADWKKGAYHVVSFPAGTYDWRKIELRFKTDAAQDTLWPRIRFAKASGTLWLDDIHLMAAAAYDNRRAVSAALETDFDRKRFVPGEKVAVFGRLRNNSTRPLTVEFTASLEDGGKSLARRQWSGELKAGDGQRIPLFTWDTTSHRPGEYLARGEVRVAGGEAESLRLPVKLCPRPRQDFFWSMWVPPHPDEDRNLPFHERLKRYDFSPTYTSLFPGAMDLALEDGLPFSARLGIPAHFSARKGAHGETWKHALGSYGISDPRSWEEGERLMEGYVQTAARYPAFSGWITTSDDFSVVSGWDWAEENRKRFKEQTGVEAPVPPVFARGQPPYSEAAQELSKHPAGAVSERDPWLLWCRFLSRDVLGRYNGALQKGAERAMRGARVGPVSGGMQWPLFHPSSAQYPPYTFGPEGFRLLSFYYYLSYWQPSLAHIYWSEVARMGNRDYPVMCLADSLSPMRHYARNNFYLLLAGGVQGISYWTYQETHPSFWEEAGLLAQVVRENGPLFAQLRPARRPVAYLLSFTAAAFNPDHPVNNVYGYVSLLNAHVDAEPICEEEVLSAWLSRYDAVILSDIRWLTPPVLQKLRDFIRRGKTVYVDSKTPVPIPGATRLPFYLGEGGTFGYGDPARLARVRAALIRRAPPWADSDDPCLALRSFEAKRAAYCWAVNVESASEYKTFRRATRGWPNEQKLTEEEWTSYEKSKNLIKGSYSSSVTLPGGGVVYDVLSGKRLAGKGSGLRRQYQLTMPRFGGALLMLLPRPITRLVVTGPERLKRGTSAPLEVRLLDDQGKPVTGVVPITVRISHGAGPGEVRHEVASGGTCRLPLEAPVNDAPGPWKISVSTRFLPGAVESISTVVK